MAVSLVYHNPWVCKNNFEQDSWGLAQLANAKSDLNFLFTKIQIFNAFKFYISLFLGMRRRLL